MKRTNNIYGMLMRPCSSTEEENESVIYSSELAKKENFMDEYRKHIIGMQIVAECAKIYILKNYEKVKSWTDLDVVIEDNTGNPTDYYNFKESKFGKSDVMKRFSERANERDKKRHNQILTLTDCVLDPADGDFSLNINGKDHLWISDDSVIVIADYIEKQLRTIPF